MTKRFTVTVSEGGKDQLTMAYIVDNQTKEQYYLMPKYENRTNLSKIADKIVKLLNWEDDNVL